MKTLNSTQDFKQKIENEKGVVAVLFSVSLTLCSRCNAARKTLKNIKKPAIPIFEYVSVPGEHVLKKLKIKSQPTLIIFKDGVEISTVSGYDEITIPKAYKEAIHANY